MRMRRHTVLVLATIVVLLVAGLGTGLAMLWLHEPSFYRRCQVAPGKERFEMSKMCVGRLAQLATDIVEGTQDWTVEITEAQLNSFFEEHFLKWGECEALLRNGIADPRVVFEDDRMRLAFRYGSWPWSTVVSFDIKVWLAPRDVNVVAVEFLGRHAGSLPFSAQSLLDVISEQASKQGVEVSWHRHDCNPVALLRFQADQLRQSFQLRRLDISQGKITVGGTASQDHLTNY